MDIENYKEAITSADLAFNNDNYEAALKWYEKALAEAPNDEYALSKAGTALVALKRFDDAFTYFQRACDAVPDSGDALFNLANAYFFSGNIAKALEYYNAAEMRKCSEDVKARIYYQMALMCTINKDYRAALINYQKYEDADKTGAAALDKDIISEKVQLYAQIEDYENAAKYAAKWVALAPDDIRAYMVCFNLMMADGKYEKAEQMLNDAEKYAVKDEAGKFAIDVSRANYYVSAAGSDADKDGSYEQKAYDLMSELIVSPSGSPEDKNELVLSLAELCIKLNKYDEAIDLMQMLTQKPEYTAGAPAPAGDGKVDPAEIDAMMQSDLAKMDSKIANGELDENLGELATVNYDENGNPIRQYPEGIFDEMPEGADPEKFGLPSPEEMAKLEKAAAEANAEEFKARVNFMLLSCYSAKEDFEQALVYARKVKGDPNNLYYNFFGRYAEAFAIKQLADSGKGGYTKQDADKLYDENIAFFRSEMLKSNENSAYALIFRTRMYAEQGKFTKAEELAELMSADDKASLLDYIAACRVDQEKKS